MSITRTRKPGFALATILILLGVALFSAGAVVTVSGLESKISVSEREGIDAYYIAEAGIDDALWKLKTNDSSCGGAGCASQLQAGTLNYSYAATNTPHATQSFSVTIVSTSGMSAGNATITAVGSVAVVGFTAHRQIVANAYLGRGAPSTGSTALFTGGNFYANSGAPRISITGGNLYASTGMSFNAAKLKDNNICFQSQGDYTSNGASLFAGNASPCLNAANYGPKPTVLTLPGFSFSYYSTNNNISYNESTANTFEAAAASQFTSCGCSTANFAGPITYISGNMNLGSSMVNKTINVAGMLIVNGSLNVNSGLGNFNMNITDPGSGMSGLFVSGTTTTNDGSYTINGVFYSGGSYYMNSPKSFTVNGALFANGDIIVNNGSSISLIYVASRVSSSFSQGTPSVLQVKHWEEQY